MKYWLSRLNSTERILWRWFINLSRTDLFLPFMLTLNCRFPSASSILKMSQSLSRAFGVILMVVMNENCTGSPWEKTALWKLATVHGWFMRIVQSLRRKRWGQLTSSNKNVSNSVSIKDCISSYSCVYLDSRFSALSFLRKELWFSDIQ